MIKAFLQHRIGLRPFSPQLLHTCPQRMLKTGRVKSRWLGHLHPSPSTVTTVVKSPCCGFFILYCASLFCLSDNQCDSLHLSFFSPHLSSPPVIVSCSAVVTEGWLVIVFLCTKSPCVPRRLRTSCGTASTDLRPTATRPPESAPSCTSTPNNQQGSQDSNKSGPSLKGHFTQNTIKHVLFYYSIWNTTCQWCIFM